MRQLVVVVSVPIFIRRNNGVYCIVFRPYAQPTNIVFVSFNIGVLFNISVRLALYIGRLFDNTGDGRNTLDMGFIRQVVLKDLFQSTVPSTALKLYRDAPVFVSIHSLKSLTVL